MKGIQFGAALLAAIFVSQSFAFRAEAAPHSFAVPVTLDPSIEGVQSGRIIVFAEKVEPGAVTADKVDFSIFAPERVSVAAREVDALAPGAAALVGTGVDVFPQSFADLAPGEYRFQAVLDRNHNYNYSGRSGGDIVSGVVTAKLPGGVPALMLKNIVPDRTMETVLASMPEERAAVLEQNLLNVRPIDFVSPALSKFWGRPIHIKGFAALPPNYKKDGARYPAVYATRGFGATSLALQTGAATIAGLMASGEAPPMIWFYLDQSIPTGAHEFADSVNNGPWGEALTEELIPYLQKEFAADPRAASRFLTGHSSGGWTSLWLQVRYPALFGGTWPTSPDPADFHAFTNIDLYAPNANAYRDENGEPRPLVRDKGKVYVTIEQYVRLEDALGPYGGQFASFDWVFSPKADDGRPEKAIDRVSGAVDADVVAYWREHYDIAHIVKRDWPKLKKDLDGKIHLYVGTADTFYLDEPSRLLKGVFDELGAHQDFTFVPDRTHFDLYKDGDDDNALLKSIAWQIYAKARPKACRAAGEVCTGAVAAAAN